MKFYFGILSLFLLLSCKQNHKPVIKEIKGSGFEPGWELSISHKTKNEYHFELTTIPKEKKEHGILILKTTPPDINDKYIFEGKDSNTKTMQISYDKKNCLNMAGDNSGGEIHILWNKKSLYGCGNYSYQ